MKGCKRRIRALGARRPAVFLTVPGNRIRILRIYGHNSMSSIRLPIIRTSLIINIGAPTISRATAPL
jgi:hypothetical protein